MGEYVTGWQTIAIKSTLISKQNVCLLSPDLLINCEFLHH